MVSEMISAGGSELSSPLQTNSAKKSLLVFVSTDKGLCGGINANLYKKVVSWARKEICFDDLLGQEAAAYTKKNMIGT